jgi:F-type H+-transporting ATPase subunit b
MAVPVPTHEGVEAAGPGHHTAFPPFASETFTSQLFWLVLAFIILYVLMAKWALPQVAGIIESRQKRIDNDVAEAGRLKEQSEAAVTAYEKALADARGRAQAIANETREKQTAAADAARKRTEDELNVRLAESEKSLAATKEAAMANVRGIAEDAAAAIVERLIGQAPGKDVVAEAVASSLKR